MPAEPRLAATIVLLREGPHGLETLLLKRSGRVGFFPHTWVFPGGRVDDADHQVARGEGGPALLGRAPMVPEQGLGIAVAALRECFEESGVWLGPGNPGQGLRGGLNGRTATLLDAPEGQELHLDRLHAWARWITPEVEPRRYDTWFFLAAVHEDEAARAVHDEQETVESRWIPLAHAVREQAPETFFLAPPTFRTIEELSRAPDLEGAFAMARANQARGLPTIMPRLEKGDAGWKVVLPGDPTHPSEHPVDGPTRIVWRETGWVSEDAPEASEGPT